jgi:hypothetical protein
MIDVRHNPTGGEPMRGGVTAAGAKLAIEAALDVVRGKPNEGFLKRHAGKSQQEMATVAIGRMLVILAVYREYGRDAIERLYLTLGASPEYAKQEAEFFDRSGILRKARPQAVPAIPKADLRAVGVLTDGRGVYGPPAAEGDWSSAACERKLRMTIWGQ